MKYFEYEQKKNMEHLGKMSGSKTFRMGLDMLQTAIKILKASLIAEKPKLKGSALHKKIREYLWQTSS